MVNPVLEAAELLEKEGIRPEVIKINRILPLDAAVCLASLRKTGRLLSLEDACRAGSVGERLLSASARSGAALRGAAQLDLGDGRVCHGAVERLRRELGMDVEGVCRAAREVLHEKDPA